MVAPDTLLQDRYRIISLIKPGNMGAVYLAEDTRLGNNVALKETFSASNEPLLRAQFHREARLLSRLHHTSLPRVTDHFIEGSGQFLVMDYIVGTDLMELLEENAGPFPVNTVLNWADQLLDVLTYLHTQADPVVHRDIKPANIKLTPQGKVILLDFGLAKGATSSMLMSLPAATMAYAPIEQVMGHGTDPRSDLFSLGVTLYHLITNTFPPLALRRQEALWKGLPDPLPPAGAVNAQVPEPITKVLTEAMALAADDRLQTAFRMRELLRGATRLSITSASDSRVVSKQQEQEINRDSYETTLSFPAEHRPKESKLAADYLSDDTHDPSGEPQLAPEEPSGQLDSHVRAVAVVEGLMGPPSPFQPTVHLTSEPPSDEAEESRINRADQLQSDPHTLSRANPATQAPGPDADLTEKGDWLRGAGQWLAATYESTPFAVALLSAVLVALYLWMSSWSQAEQSTQSKNRNGATTQVRFAFGGDGRTLILIDQGNKTRLSLRVQAGKEDELFGVMSKENFATRSDAESWLKSENIRNLLAEPGKPKVAPMGTKFFRLAREDFQSGDVCNNFVKRINKVLQFGVLTDYSRLHILNPGLQCQGLQLGDELLVNVVKQRLPQSSGFRLGRPLVPVKPSR